MDADSQNTRQDSPQSTARSHMNNADLPTTCALCRKILSPDNEASGDLAAINICGDCKFLFLEDFESSPLQDSYRRRPSRGRRTRYNSSESIDDLFSQQFSNIINMLRQNQAIGYGHEDQPIDGDVAATRLIQHTSLRTGSSRWSRRVLSDTESDGYDNLDSLYGESESNVSFGGGYRAFHGESDTVSYSAYGGESDVSVDGRSYLDSDMFVAHPDETSDLDSDTDDIDPMHAGLSQWNSDGSDEGERNSFHSREFQGTVGWRTRNNSRQTFSGLVENLHFEELIEQFTDIESSIRGAPPASVFIVKNLPRVVINNHEKRDDDDLACAICKDILTTGTEVNRLPCSHLYHPSCILPWLSTRNSCPLCRYELPTDDKDYEEGKHGVREIEEGSNDDDSSSDETEDEFNYGDHEVGTVVNNEGGRGRWFFLAAAAPIVSLVGFVLVLWLGNNPREGQLRIQSGDSCPLNRRENRGRRWWSLF